jgi:hypothetical protein
MKKVTIILMALIAVTIKTNAQIPNGGFEAWTTFGSYENPTGVWTTFNSYSTGTFFPVTKSSDHYPSDVGNYSIRMENNISISVLQPPAHAPGCGLAYTTHSLQIGPQTAFPITGHPTSFCGYYKFLSQNNDTMCILLLLYKNGSSVSQAILTGTSTVSNWTSFKIPIPSYTTVDSASILLASFFAFPNHSPQGNSVLYVDNLSFDELITSVTEKVGGESPNSFALEQNYPNPFNPTSTIKYHIPVSSFVKLSVFDILGHKIAIIVNEEKEVGNYVISFDASGLSPGVYFYHIQAGKFQETRKLVLLK